VTPAAARLAATLRTDARLQLRYGFYAVGVFMAAIWIAILSQLPKDAVRTAIPAFLFLNGNVTTFFFVAGLVLYEKREGVLEALVVTPLRAGEYLVSKLVTLTILAAVEALAVVGLGWGFDLRWGPVVLGVVAVGVIFTLIGLLIVFRFDSINEFLLPGSLVSTALQLPVFSIFDIWSPAAFWLWPTRGPLLLLQGAFAPLAPAEWLYALVSSVVWIAGLWIAVRRSFHRFVLRREGTRR